MLSILKLNRERWVKIGKGLVVAVSGAALGYLTTFVLPELANSGQAGAILAVMGAQVANYLKQLLELQKEESQ